MFFILPSTDNLQKSLNLLMRLEKLVLYTNRLLEQFQEFIVNVFLMKKTNQSLLCLDKFLKSLQPYVYKFCKKIK